MMSQKVESDRKSPVEQHFDSDWPIREDKEAPTEGFVWLGLDGNLSPQITHDMGAAFMLYAQGLLPFLMPLSALLFEPNAKSRKRMLPFLVVGGLLALFMLWALIAYPFEIYVKNNSIVYINQGSNHTLIAFLYVIATCGSFLFSRIKDIVLFGVANLAILLVVLAVKRYAFTSLWCAYAALASVSILAYFWKTSELDRSGMPRRRRSKGSFAVHL